MKQIGTLLLGVCVLLAGVTAGFAASTMPRVLVFTKTTGYRHGSISSGVDALEKMGVAHGFAVDHTENSADFTEQKLVDYRAVVFLNTTGNVLNPQQKNAFERYIQAGGGFVGIHSAADTEYEWAWYDKLLGAHFSSHPEKPNVRKALIRVTDKGAAASAGLPDEWVRTDEWYNYRSFYPGLRVLASLDEESYEGGTNGSNHPILWQHEFDGGRAFYTGGGHEESSYREPLFLAHLWGGIQYAMGGVAPLDFSKAHSRVVPEENRFEKTVLIDHLGSPMTLAVSGDGKVFITQLAGKLSMFDPATNRTKIILNLPVSQAGGSGLLGVTLDPHFEQNRFLYLYHSLPTDEAPIHFHLSRYTLLENGMVDVSSEKILLDVPVALNGAGHHGGSMGWDQAGNLYLSTGDSTAPHPAQGFAPLDERPLPESREQDSQRSAANTNDLRGKILRITPQADGSYTIPAGNLFPPGTALTRPEIYVMGVRNPYRIALNPKSSVLYWGDIGPDAGVDADRGPRGYDEFNQAFRAGNFGWPYFIGNNYAYAHWDYTTKQAGPRFSVAHPENLSPNNTGLKELPPPQPAMVWYPYAGSAEFPELGEGGRSAMAGEFYVYPRGKASPRAIPEYFDGALFVFDWMRNWMMAMRVDDHDRFQRFEPFMASNGDFRRPIDLAFSPDGILYVLEYGSVYGVDNDDARLVRIEYNAGNRPPVAQAGIRDAVSERVDEERSYLTSDHRRYRHLLREIAGPVPLQVSFSGRASDPDADDELRYEWNFEGKGVEATTPQATHTFTKPGAYSVLFRVKDKAGATGVDEVSVVAGNAKPVVQIETVANKSFFWNDRPLDYHVTATDTDGAMDLSKVQVQFRYEAQPAGGVQLLGASLMAASDCRACHTLDKPSVGPNLLLVAKRYHGQPEAKRILAEKIIRGGGGNWGTQFVMAAHPQIPLEDAEEIVAYILSLENSAPVNHTEPMAGTLHFDQHKPGEPLGRYTIDASYADSGGNNTPALTGFDAISWRNAIVPVETVDAYVGFNRWGPKLAFGQHKAHLYLKDIDLTGIAGFTFTYSAPVAGEIEIRKYSYNGPVLSRVAFVESTTDREATAGLKEPISERCDLYFIVRHPEKPNDNVITLKSIRFEHGDSSGK